MVAPVDVPKAFVVVLAVASATATLDAFASSHNGATLSVFVGEASETAACVRGSLLYNFTLDTGADFGPPFGAAACSRSGDRRKTAVAAVKAIAGVAVADCSFEGDLLIRWCASTGSAGGRLPLLCAGGGGDLYRIQSSLVQEFMAGRCVLGSGERAGTKYSIRGENAAAMKFPDCAVDVRQEPDAKLPEALEDIPPRKNPRFSEVPGRRLHEEEEDDGETTTAEPNPANKQFGTVLLIVAISFFFVLIITVQILHKSRTWEPSY